MHFFLASDLQPAGDDSFVPRHEEAEMTGAWVPVDDLLAAVVDGRVGDGPLVQGLLLAQAKGLLA
jgi:ADP-ribose pyrophosphatase